MVFAELLTISLVRDERGAGPGDADVRPSGYIWRKRWV